MSTTDLTSWYVAFGLGGVCVFAVVIAVTTMLQLSSRIGGQLTVVRDALTAIRTDTAAIPAIREINADLRQLNAVLAETSESLSRLLQAPAS